MRELQVVNAAELAAAYAAADYMVMLDDDTLRLQVGQPAPDLEAYWPARRYAFITAWNPASRPTAEAANQAADAALVAQIDALALTRQPAWAEDGSGDWREPGWLLADIDPLVLDALAHEFGQAATLEWQHGQPVALRMYLPRPRGEAAPAHTHWVE
jgi:hypothetical protein